MTQKRKKEKTTNADEVAEKKVIEEEGHIDSEKGEPEIIEPETDEHLDKELEPDEDKMAAQWRQEKEELLDKLKRKQADLDNLRRISKNEQAQAREYALHEFLCRLLPVIDNIERGIEAALNNEDVPAAYIEGLDMIRKQLMQLLEQESVSVIEAEGTIFDPHCHHAVMQVEDKESDPGTVLEELQKGYRHRNRILRPAMVKVCRE